LLAYVSANYTALWWKAGSVSVEDLDSCRSRPQASALVAVWLPVKAPDENRLSQHVAVHRIHQREPRVRSLLRRAGGAPPWGACASPETVGSISRAAVRQKRVIDRITGLSIMFSLRAQWRHVTEPAGLQRARSLGFSPARSRSSPRVVRCLAHSRTSATARRRPVNTSRSRDSRVEVSFRVRSSESI
jgi:hypothetical protein